MGSRSRRAVLAALTAAAVLCQTPAAQAACPQVHLVVGMSNPVLNDYLQLTYSVTVTNLGPATATGIVARRTALFCRTVSTPLAECRPVPAADSRVVDLGPGQGARFLAVVQLITTDPTTVRTTVEVTHVDQPDVASVPGTCAEGTRPQDDCATVVTVLR
jgi:hypothetical protein